MTFGFAMLTVGTLLLYSGYTNSSVAEVLQGLAVKTSGGPGETGFVSLLTAPVDAITPGGGGEGMPGKVPAGLTSFDGKPVCKWVAAELRWARKHGWTGQLTSGFRSTADQARVCSEVPPGTPCAPPGQSNHQGTRYPKCAADVTEPELLDRVLSRKRFRKLKYAGPQANDPPHFSSGLTGV